MGEKEPRECLTEDIPPWHGIRWLRDCHSQVGKMEADILVKGITPESLNWPKRAKNWFFTHGGRLNLETEKLVHGPKLERATQRFSYALQAKAIGEFRPNREKDELTYAIRTAEHSGRMRGLGRNISWEHGFPNDKDTYRSR